MVTDKQINSPEFLQYARDMQFKDEQSGKVRNLVALTKKADDMQELWLKSWRTLDICPRS